MNRIFLSELNKEQNIGMVLNNGVEHDYTIIDIYTDGIKVKMDTGKIFLVPFTAIKYVRVKINE